MKFLNRALTLFVILLPMLITSQQKDFNQIMGQANALYYSNPDSSYRILKSIDVASLDGAQKASLALSKAKYLILTTDYESAEVELQNAIQYYTGHDEKDNLAAAFSLKSILAERIGEEDASRFLLLEALSLNEETGYVAGQTNKLHNLVSCYLRMNDPDSAYYYLNKLEQIEGSLEEDSFYFLYQNWARYYNLIAEYPLSLEYFDKALKVAEEHQMTDSKASCLMLIADTYKNMEDYINAEKYAYMSYAYSETNGLIYEKSEALEVMLRIAELKQDYQTAYKFLNELMDVNKEIFNLEKLNKVKQVKSILDLAEKEKELASQKALNAQKDLETSEAQSKTRMFMISLIAVSLILGLLAFAFVKNKKLTTIIKYQKTEVDNKNSMLSEALKDIEDSLTYSKFIQNALLPSGSKFQSSFADYFIMYCPKEKVSGDFYWMHRIENNVFFCVADCTGHGVPGALVSVVGSNALNTSIKEQKISDPCKILDRMSEIVAETLTTEDGAMRDGMDITLCKLNLDTLMLTYSGANNPLYVMNINGLNIYRPNKQPVGHFEARVPFTQEEIQLRKGDSVYLFSDGYADQFGGPVGKKFMYKELRNLLANVNSLAMEAQKKELETAFENWKGNYEQVDDVCVIGVRV